MHNIKILPIQTGNTGLLNTVYYLFNCAIHIIFAALIHIHFCGNLLQPNFKQHD